MLRGSELLFWDRAGLALAGTGTRRVHQLSAYSEVAFRPFFLANSHRTESHNLWWNARANPANTAKTLLFHHSNGLFHNQLVISLRLEG